MKLLVIGGVGIENKKLITSQCSIKTKSIGGSAWFTAIVGNALSLNVWVLSRFGNDEHGIFIREAFEKKNISFCGIIEGETQIFSSIINFGEPRNYNAKYDNLSYSQFLSVFNVSAEYDIIIATYNDPDTFLCISENVKKYKLGKKQFIVANPSGSIISMGTNVIDILQGYDIVTMNRFEAETVASFLQTDITGLLIRLNQRNKRVFITSKNTVDYIDFFGKINRYNFTPIKNVIDATGAGDSFTVALAYSFMLGIETEQSIANAVNIAQTMCMTKSKSEINSGEWLSKIV